MKNINSEFLVCSPGQVQALLSLGILPLSVFCFENVAGQWEFAGEYFDQKPVIPAWTMEELCILIGGDYPKPDLFSKQDWGMDKNMMQWALHLPRRRSNFLSGSQAMAALLEHLLTENRLTPDDCNARLAAFITKDNFNLERDRLIKEAEEKNQ